MNRGLKIGIGIAGTLAVLGMVGYGYVSMAMAARLGLPHLTHTYEVPVPFPLSEQEIAELRAEKEKALAAEAPAPDGEADADSEAAADGEAPAEGEAAEAEAVDVLADVDLDALALQRAQERGKHLVEARFACIECHGGDFTGGVMVDDGAMGTWLGPNITGGEGSPAKDYTIADWDRIVRHGVKKNGRAAIMPSEDFVNMSDRELSDIIAYIKTFAPVDKKVPAPTFGPIGSVLLARGDLPLSAEHHAGNNDHPKEPPEATVSVAFGRHLSQICTGCHRAELNGGPIAVGPPNWPPARNLTPHADGLEGWSLDDFKVAMREGKRPDGSELLEPMTLIKPYAQKMTETEIEALFTYLQSLPPTATGA